MSSTTPENPEAGSTTEDAAATPSAEPTHTPECGCARCLIARYGENGALLNPSSRPGPLAEYRLEVILDKDGQQSSTSYGLVSSLEEITTVCMPQAAADAATRGETIVEQFIAVYQPYYRLTTQPLPAAATSAQPAPAAP